MIAENRGMMKTFLLGLSAGGACMTHCGSILLPLLLCQKTRRWKLAAGFLMARLTGYLVFALISLGAGRWIADPNNFQHIPFLEASVLILLGFCLLRHGWSLRGPTCDAGACGLQNGPERFRSFRESGIHYALKTGFLTGFSLCVPFVALLIDGLQQTSISRGLMTFLAFYVGTTAMLLPVLAGGLAFRGTVSRQIGFLTGSIAATIYLLQGIHLLILEVIHVQL
jgi:sulfite exporter TauE/SafE